jgi:hypothetical protein
MNTKNELRRAQEHVAAAEALGLLAKSTMEGTAHYVQPERRVQHQVQQQKHAHLIAADGSVLGPHPLGRDTWATGIATTVEGNIRESVTIARSADRTAKLQTGAESEKVPATW